MIRQVIKNDIELTEFLSDFGTSFAFDTETTSLSYMDMEVIGVSLCDGRKACYITNLTPQLSICIKQLFDRASTVVAHNIVFDMKALSKLNISLTGKRLYDTMIADHLLDERREHGLKYLAKELLGHDVSSYAQASQQGTNTQEFYEYAMNDAIWTWQLMKWQQIPMVEQKLVTLFREIEMPFQFVIFEMETNGILVDMSKVSVIKQQLHEAFEDSTALLLSHLGVTPTFQSNLLGETTLISPINFNSTQVLNDILFKKMGLKPKEKTPKGVPSVGKITLDAYKDHPFVAELIKYKTIQKLLSGFFEPMEKYVDSDGKIRSHFHDTGTRTGRLSSSSPNLQQLPKPNKAFPVATRSCFIAEPGYKMITCDFSGQELRVLAHVTQAKNMINAFLSGKDFHSATAEQFGVDRTRAKAINFGIAYRKGAFGFAKDWNVTEEEAQQYLDKYFAEFPEVKDAMDRNDTFINSYGYTTSMTGRRRRFDKIQANGWEGYPRKVFREGFNFLIQGYSADMMRIALNKIYANRPKEYDIQLLATVHDEGVFQVKEEYVEEASKFIKDTFESCVHLCVPILSEIGVGKNYDEAK